MCSLQSGVRLPAAVKYHKAELGTCTYYSFLPTLSASEQMPGTVLVNYTAGMPYF